MISNNILAASLLHFPFVLIDVFPPNLCDYKFIMIVHVILCLNEREIEKKKRKKKQLIKKIKSQSWFLIFMGHFQP